MSARISTNFPFAAREKSQANYETNGGRYVSRPSFSGRYVNNWRLMVQLIFFIFIFYLFFIFLMARTGIPRNACTHCATNFDHH